MEIRCPKNPEEFNAYYELRYKVLRAPWGQERGTEKDELEDSSIHIAAFDDGKIIACGRVHKNSSDEAQIRYMAIDETYRGNGVGQKVLFELEVKAKETGAKYVILNARESASGFYSKASYHPIGAGHMLFGEIAHVKMRKELN